GSASNRWTLVFDGDINLSACMSFFNIMCSFIMMPLWLMTIGQKFYLNDLKIKIPYFYLFRSLATVIIPLSIGVLLSYFIPKLSDKIRFIIKPTMLFCIIYFLVFGTIVNFYLFKMINLTTALSTPLLPWLGFLFGALFAYLLKQDWTRIKTVGIETGIQNISIAFMVLLYSFPQPESGQATVIPLIISYLSEQPFHIALLYKIIRRKYFNKVPNTDIQHELTDL
ncbi:unnamed protein product, partial [Didymodactylos carnosus]